MVDMVASLQRELDSARVSTQCQVLLSGPRYSIYRLAL